MSEKIKKNIDKVKENLLGCGSWEWSRSEGKQMNWSEQLRELLEIDSLVDSNIEQFIGFLHPDESEMIHETIKYQMKELKNVFDIEHLVVTGEGNIKKILHRVNATYSKDGKPEQLIGVCIDQTFRSNRDYSTRLNNEKFFRLFGDAPMGVSLLRIDGTCFLCNDSLVETIHYKDYELRDLPFYTLIADDDQHKFLTLFQSVVSNQIPSFRNEYRIITRDGESVWHDITVSSVKDIYDTIKYLIVMVQPCQRNLKVGTRKGLIKSIREELSDLSLRDSLSGLYNRQYVLRRLKELILVFYERHLSFTALMIDVDSIHEINDKYGHACGDKVIHDLSDVFKSLTRDTDICARWGGEEFVILVPEMNIEAGELLAERVRNEVKNTIMMWEGKEIQVTVSIGVTTYTSDDTLKTFINKVDNALYNKTIKIKDKVIVI